MEHIKNLIKLDVSSFSKLLLSLQVGIEHVDVKINGQCCSALDRLISTYTNPSKDDLITKNSLGSFFVSHGEIFANLLLILFKKVLFEDCQSQWFLFIFYF